MVNFKRESKKEPVKIFDSQWKQQTCSRGENENEDLLIPIELVYQLLPLLTKNVIFIAMWEQSARVLPVLGSAHRAVGTYDF